MFIREDSDLWQCSVGAKPKEENKMHPEFLWSQELMNWPSHSKTQTPLKSDPLWLECYVIDADEELVGSAALQTFMVTADSFFQFNEDPENICAADKQLSQNKSPALYQYGNVQQFWVRSIACREHYD